MNLGLDIGGTKIAAGMVDENLKIIKKAEHKTEADLGFEKVLLNIEKCVSALKPTEKFEKIGIGIAGQVNIEEGILIFSPNMPELENIKVGKLVKEKLAEYLFENSIIAVDNDANAFALAEHKVGLGQGSRNLAVLTLGTGVGGGLILNNKLYHGAGFASELGHMIVAVKGRKCSCGLLGHLESYTSGTSIEKMYFEKTGVKKKAYDIEIDALKKNDQIGLGVYEKAATHLGFGLSSIINILDPEMIILGGGIGRSDLIYEKAKEVCYRNIFYKNRKTKIEKSKLSNDAAIIGAVLLTV